MLSRTTKLQIQVMIAGAIVLLICINMYMFSSREALLKERPRQETRNDKPFSTEMNNPSNVLKSYQTQLDKLVNTIEILKADITKQNADNYNAVHILGGAMLERNNPVCKKNIHYKCVIYVYSRTDDFKQRNFIRNSYGNAHVLQGYNITLRFVIGLPAPNSISKIMAEQTLQRDVVVLSAHNDEYRTLNSKANLGLSWLYKNCNNTETYMKVDDDVLIDYPPLFKYIREEVPNHLNSVHCQKIIRGKLEHCHGHLVLFHRVVLEKLLWSIPQVTTNNWIEDQYTYGYLRKAANVNIIDISSHKVWLAYRNSSIVTNEVLSGSKWYYGDHIKDMPKWWGILQTIRHAAAVNNFTGINDRYLYQPSV